MNEHAAFKERLNVCVGRASSQYALAKKAQIPISTLRRYFEDSEPTRPNLNAIASAAGVSLTWLATGWGTPDGEQPPPPEKPELPIYFYVSEGFANRLGALVTRYGGLSNFCAAHSVSSTAIEHVLQGQGATSQLLDQLAADRRIPIRWLLSESGNSREFLSDKIQNAFWDRLEKIDSWRMYSGELSGDAPNNYIFASFDWRSPLLDLFAQIYEELPPANYVISKVGGSVISDCANQGDLMVIDQGEKNPSNGLYAFKGSDSEVYAVSLTNTGGVLRARGRDGRLFPFLLVGDDETGKIGDTCLGRVVFLAHRSPLAPRS